MKKNIGSPDKLIRILFAVVVLVLSLTDVISGTLALVLGFVALVLFVTALVGTCPLYMVLNLSTRKSETPA